MMFDFDARDHDFGDGPVFGSEDDGSSLPTDSRPGSREAGEGKSSQGSPGRMRRQSSGGTRRMGRMGERDLYTKHTRVVAAETTVQDAKMRRRVQRRAVEFK